MTRPRAQKTAYRIVAAPYNGWLHDDQLWTIEEWYRQELRRRKWRDSAQRRRNKPAFYDDPNAPGNEW